MKTYLFILFAFVFTSVGFCKDPNLIIKNLQKKFEQVKDYEADVNVKVNLDLLKVPESNAKIYFKHPDKIKIKSEKFSLLPKEGLNFLPKFFSRKDYTALFIKEDNLNGIKVSVIKIIPMNETGDIALVTLWIDEANSILRKAEISTKTNGVYTIEMNYDHPVNGFYMPSSMKFTFNAGNMAPKGSDGGEFGENDRARKKRIASKGTVLVTYSNYKVNQGLSDSIFNEKKK